MEFKDYYQTLGVAKTASEKEIKQAYRKLARKFHPDVNPGDKAAEAKFKEINEANEVLADPDKRKKYDELGANWRMYEQAQQHGQPWPGGAGSPFDTGGQGGAWTINMGGGPGGYRTMTEDEMQEPLRRPGSVLGLFQDVLWRRWRTRRGPRAGRTRRAQSKRARHRAPGRSHRSKKAFHGATRRISIKQGGHARSVDVRIPPGVKDGSRVRAAGEGEAGANGGASGDLYLRVQTRPHPVFERKGDDLHTTIGVPVTTAVLGGEAQVPTINGSVRLENPGNNPERSGVPVEGPRHARRRQAGHTWRPLCNSRRATAPLALVRAARGVRATGKARIEPESSTEN